VKADLDPSVRVGVDLLALRTGDDRRLQPVRAPRFVSIGLSPILARLSTIASD